MALGVAVLGFGTVQAQTPDPEAESLSAAERVEALLERAEAEQGRLTSLRASFVQIQEGPLLLEAEESIGTLHYLAPERVRWDFEPPADTVVVLTREEMLTWYRGLGEAERRRFDGPGGERLQRLLGAVPSLAELKRYFDLTVAFPADPSAPYRIDLEPRSSRVARRIREVQLQLHRTLYVPVQVRYVEASGNMTEIRFQDIETDLSVAEELFRLELPSEVAVRELP